VPPQLLQIISDDVLDALSGRGKKLTGFSDLFRVAEVRAFVEVGIVEE